MWTIESHTFFLGNEAKTTTSISTWLVDVQLMNVFFLLICSVNVLYDFLTKRTDPKSANGPRTKLKNETPSELCLKGGQFALTLTQWNLLRNTRLLNQLVFTSSTADEPQYCKWNSFVLRQTCKNCQKKLKCLSYLYSVLLEKNPKTWTRTIYIRRGKTVVIWNNKPHCAMNVIMSLDTKLSRNTCRW